MYDPMVAKLIVWDVDREHATRRMLRALDEYEIGGLTTLIPFHKAILATDQWARRRDLPRPDGGPRVAEDRPRPRPPQAPATTEEGGEVVTRDYKVEVSGKLFDVKVIGEAGRRGARACRRRQEAAEARAQGGRLRRSASSESLPSPLQGTVLKVAVEQGATVEEGDLICVIEAMKMENEISRPPRRQGHHPQRRRRRGRLQRRRPRRDRVSRSASAFGSFFRAVPSFLLLVSAAVVPCASAGFPTLLRWQVRPTQSSSRFSSSWWRKLRIGK